MLIADDHRLYRDGLESILAREDGIEVVGRASTGEEAVELASELRPDLILMDLEMPVMDGVVATRRIRAAHHVRVFLLTSSDSPSDVARARSAGALFLPKTIEPGALLAKVHDVRAQRRRVVA